MIEFMKVSISTYVVIIIILIKIKIGFIIIYCRYVDVLYMRSKIVTITDSSIIDIEIRDIVFLIIKLNDLRNRIRIK